MSNSADARAERIADRKLGDEWLDWDGSISTTDPVRKGIFVGVAAIAVAFVIGCARLFVWLVEPRLHGIDPMVFTIVNWAAYFFCGILILWLLFFSISSLTGTSMFGGLLVFPRAVNWLLNIALKVSGVLGISKDKLVNSFLRVHNILLPGQKVVSPSDLLVLLPRCLARENFAYMRSLRDKYKFDMVTAGGGQEARKKIMTSKPKAIIAIACERDLLSGFVEVNPRIPVLGLPIMRPEGPCKNTIINQEDLETLLRKLFVGK
jgi:hypothetical protein